MQYEDYTELLICQALDILEPSAAAQIIPTLEQNPGLESELTQWKTVANTPAYDAPLLPMPNLKERLFQKIKGEKNPTKAIRKAIPSGIEYNP